MSSAVQQGYSRKLYYEQAQYHGHVDACREIYNHCLYRRSRRLPQGLTPGWVHELRNTDEYLSYTPMQDLLLDINIGWTTPTMCTRECYRWLPATSAMILIAQKKKNTAAKLGYSIGSHRESVAALSTGWQFIGRPSEP